MPSVKNRSELQDALKVEIEKVCKESMNYSLATAEHVEKIVVKVESYAIEIFAPNEIKMQWIYDAMYEVIENEFHTNNLYELPLLKEADGTYRYAFQLDMYIWDYLDGKREW